jgi:hypothetical protein
VQVVHQADAPDIAVLFLDPINRPECEPSPARSFLVRESLARVRRDLLLEVKPKLVIEFALDGVSLEQGTESESPVL